MNILPVILSGGSGTRLWPISRSAYPKQFLKLGLGENSLLQETVNRVSGCGFLPPMLICNHEHRFIIAEQMRSIGFEDVDIILEPIAKNTAPAIALAALRSIQNGMDPLLVVLPADHFIENSEEFHRALSVAIDFAEKGKLVTFGISPSKPETGYGYIEMGSRIVDSEAFKVRGFVEKPDLDTAKKYVDSKNFLWNSGIFVFKASRYLDELEAFAPEIFGVCENAIKKSNRDLSFLSISYEDFASCPEDSIDYAVMERTSDAVVVPMNAGWNDVGSWSALWDIGEKDVNGSVIRGDVETINSFDNYIYADSRLVTVLGLSNLIVIESKDAVMVAHKNHVQDVKKIVAKLKDKDREEYKLHPEVYRPWGVYVSVDAGHRYQVKRITVKPGAKLSVQMHHHRAEHWIIVSGTAKIKNGDKEYLLTENQSTYIPVGQIHALENPGSIPLELIEVQSGSYLGEDDIVRISDVYGRV